MKQSQLKQQLNKPKADYRPWPFFVLNEEHEGPMGEARITDLLEKMKAVGFGGAYIHPRPGMITEYMSDRWFDLVRHSVRECKRLGLKAALYDENSYPSGFAGGHVSAKVPAAYCRFVTCQVGHGPENLPENCLQIRAWKNRKPGHLLDRAQIQDGQAWVAFPTGQMAPMPFHGDTIYPSLIDPRTTEAFLETTHERYRQELTTQDWRYLSAIFTDEPHLPGRSHGPWTDGLHFSPYIMAEFRRRYRYEIESEIHKLFFPCEGAEKVRFDYYDLLHHLWLKNWGQPLATWCRDHRIKLTGHYLEHDWPIPYATPGHIHLMARQDWPGTDLLETFHLLGHDFDDPQNLDPANPGNEPHALYFLKQAQSLAHQLGKERIMNESWGAGGHDSTPADWLRIGRFMAVHGVNHFVPHHTLTTIRGTRKMDHPQFFGDQSTWFSHLGKMNDELARLSWFSTAGQAEQRILLLDALTSGYLLANKSDAMAMNKVATATDPFGVANSVAVFKPLRDGATSLAQMLSDALLDFDIGDEYVIEDEAKATRKGLVLGEQTYSLIVWPKGLSNLRSASVQILEAYLRQGGRIIGVGRPRKFFVDGKRSEILDEWQARYPEQLSWHANNRAAKEEILQTVPTRLTLPQSLHPGIAVLWKRFKKSGKPYALVVNSHPSEAIQSSVLIEGHEFMGQIYDPAENQWIEHKLGQTLLIPPAEARILIPESKERGVSSTPKLEAVTKHQATSTLPATPLQLLSARPLSPNIFALDWCRLHFNGRKEPWESVYAANERYWKHHGFDHPGWFMHIQYRDQLLRREKFVASPSGGTVEYTFNLGQGVATKGIRLAVERPDLWKVKVNSKVLSFTKAKAWRDPRLLATEAGAYLRAGRNTIELIADSFDIRQEIDQIYLLGDFAVSPASHGFTLRKPARGLKTGSWLGQGLPFYDDTVDYLFKLPRTRGELILPADSWQGSVVEVETTTSCQTFYGPEIRTSIQSTEPWVRLRITGLPKNLFGPWHDPKKMRKRAWAIAWHWGDTIPLPRPGKDYDLLDLGLLSSPLWLDQP